MTLLIEREQPALALDRQIFTAGRDFNAVNRLASQAICSAENLNGTHQIELLDGRYNKDDYAPIRCCLPPHSLEWCSYPT